MKKTTHPSDSNQGTRANVDCANTRGKPYSAPLLTIYGTVIALTQGGASGASEGGTRSSRKSSDSTLKENINLVGRHTLGFGLYLFDYKPAYQPEYGHGRQFGVMAQEVEPIVPSAVSLNAAGFKVVDYSLLGIQLVRH